MDIYGLFKRELKITIDDDQGNSVELIIIKPNIGNDDKIATAMAKAREEAIEEIKKSETVRSEIETMLGTMDKEAIIAFIVSNEEPFRRSKTDIAPIGDRDDMSEDEIAKKEEEFVQSWRDKRTEELKGVPLEEATEMVRNLITDIRATLKAGDAYGKNLLLYCIRDLNGKRIFKNIDDVCKLDRRTFDKLLSEANKFIESLTQQDIRKGAQEKNFLSSTESEKSTESSQPLTE